jgi:beta-phosphoglucomutase-like phosphatase (HAD superfamily)
MPIEAVIFDMDGVLVDSEPYWLQSRTEFARDAGKSWMDTDQRAAMGRNTVEWARVMRERLGVEMTVEAIIDDMLRRMVAHYEARLPVRPGRWRPCSAASEYRVALASGRRRCSSGEFWN